MRETRNAQASVFQFYAPHVLGDQLSILSDLLDDHPLILDCVESDFRVPDTAATGASGLSVEAYLAVYCSSIYSKSVAK